MKTFNFKYIHLHNQQPVEMSLFNFFFLKCQSMLLKSCDTFNFSDNSAATVPYCID